MTSVVIEVATKKTDDEHIQPSIQDDLLSIQTQKSTSEATSDSAPVSTHTAEKAADQMDLSTVDHEGELIDSSV